MAQYLLDKGLTEGVVVSPDLGSAKKARNFAMELDWPLALIEKRRSQDGSSTKVMNLIGAVEGRDVVLVDDEIDTAGTICNAARFVLDCGARRVYAMATHGIFSPPAIERLRDAPFEEIVVTNTVLLPGAAAAQPHGAQRRPAPRRGDPPHPRRPLGRRDVRRVRPQPAAARNGAA